MTSGSLSAGERDGGIDFNTSLHDSSPPARQDREASEGGLPGL